MNVSYPLVTCMTLSRAPRLAYLAEAIHDFDQQTWPQKELLIVLDDVQYYQSVLNLIKGSDADISVINCEHGITVGGLRNVVIDNARGEYICQWDDDDRYSKDRLQMQTEAVLNSSVSACFLFQQLHYFESTRELFCTDWRLFDGREGVPVPYAWIPGTVLFRLGSTRYPEEGEYCIRGEDTAFAMALKREGAIGIEVPPETYLRVFHGRNSWDLEHHRAIAQRRSVCPDKLIQLQEQLAKAAQQFALGSSISVMAANGLVYRI